MDGSIGSSSRFLLCTVLAGAIAGVVVGQDKDQTRNAAHSLEDFSDLTQCEASTSVKLVITGGSGSVRGTASCRARVETVNAIVNSMQKWMESVAKSPETACTVDTFNKVAEDIGLAIALTYTLAGFDLKLDGNGTACVSAEADADGYALIFAKAILEVPVKRSVMGTKADGLCLHGALSAVFAAAWSTAKNTTCVDGPGGFSDTQVSFAKSVEMAIRRVVGEVAARVCASAKGQEEAMMLNKSQSPGERRIEVSAEKLTRIVEGMAIASGGNLSQCTGAGVEHCCGLPPLEGCEWTAKAALLWEIEGGQTCCCVEGLLSL